MYGSLFYYALKKFLDPESKIILIPRPITGHTDAANDVDLLVQQVAPLVAGISLCLEMILYREGSRYVVYQKGIEGKG